jgi:hypothetical protein
VSLSQLAHANETYEEGHEEEAEAPAERGLQSGDVQGHAGSD